MREEIQNEETSDDRNRDNRDNQIIAHTISALERLLRPLFLTS